MSNVERFRALLDVFTLVLLQELVCVCTKRGDYREGAERGVVCLGQNTRYVFGMDP